jgi:hypothetical protein
MTGIKYPNLKEKLKGKLFPLQPYWAHRVLGG